MLAVIFTCLPGSARAVKVSYVSTIRQGLLAPTSLHVGADRIAALQPYGKQILAFTPDGAATHRIDISGDARGLAHLAASVYVFCDRAARQVIAVDISDGRQWVFLDALTEPADIAVANGECYVLDAGSRRIVRTNDQGSIIGHINLASLTQAPNSMAFDPVRNVFHVFDQIDSRAHVLDQSGQHLGSYGSFGNDGGTITRGGDLACDGDGYIYIVDRYQGRVAVFDPEWRFLLDIRAGSLAGEPLMIPTGIAVDANGTIYVASTEGDCIHAFILDKTAIPDGNLAAAPLFPASAGRLPADEVKLVARLAAVPEAGATLEADFRIVEATSPEILVAEAIGVTPDELGLDDSGRLVGTATWQPATALSPGATYLWQTRARMGGVVGDWSEAVSFSTHSAAVRYDLEANYPNPFNPSTTIAFSVPDAAHVDLEIYDLTGTLVWRKTLTGLAAGRHTEVWYARNSRGNPVASGVYFYRLRAEGFQQTRKMVLIR
jgi:hypothetical protein